MSRVISNLVSLILLTVIAGGQSVVAQGAGSFGEFAFQGELRDAGGLPVEDGSYAMVFTIYDDPTAGAVLWTESQAVTVTGGLFTAKTLRKPAPRGLFGKPSGGRDHAPGVNRRMHAKQASNMVRMPLRLVVIV